MFVTTKELLSKNKVVPAFNFSTAEVARAIVEACDELGQDVILQTSMGEASFLGPGVAAGIAKTLGQKSNISVSLHLDHAKDTEIIKAAVAAGYTSFLVDVSEFDFEEGVAFINSVKSFALDNVVVEASLAEFDRAVEFVEKTNPDLLAPFTIVDSKDVSEIDKMTLVSRLVNTPLVLHNGSSKSAEEVKAAITAGAVKINWNTCLREAWSRTLRQTLSSHPDEIKPYNILKPSVEAVRKVVEEKVKLLW